MSHLHAAKSTAVALKRSALLSLGLLIVLCGVSVATSFVAMQATARVAELAIFSNEQRQIWIQLGRLALYRPPPQVDKTVEVSLLAELRTDTKRLLQRSREVEAKIAQSISPTLKLALFSPATTDWDQLRSHANVDAELMRKFSALSLYPDDLLALGMEVWGSEMQVAILSGEYLTPLNWVSNRAAEMAVTVQRRATYGLAAINLALIIGGIAGWRRVLIPTYRQWEQAHLELLHSTEKVMERSAQFQGAFQAITDAACLLDDKGRILAVNFEFPRVFGVSARDATQDWIDNVIIRAIDKDAPRSFIVHPMSEQRVKDKDMLATYNGRFIRLADDRQAILQVSRIGPDSWLFLASIQGNAERSLARKMHDEHLQQIGIYTAGVAHDLNNMLGTISGRVQVFRVLSMTPKTIAEFLSTLETTVSRGKALVSDLLKFSRSSTPQPAFMTAAELERDLRETITVGGNIAFTIRRADDFILNIDKKLLVSAIENISRNSIDAIGERRGTLLIEMRSARMSGLNRRSAYASVIIQDNGGGLSAAALDRAFEPFFSTKPFGKGTGLGLAIVKGFVDQSGGDIQICNVDGGARVELLLPTVDMESSVPAE